MDRMEEYNGYSLSISNCLDDGYGGNCVCRIHTKKIDGEHSFNVRAIATEDAIDGQKLERVEVSKQLEKQALQEAKTRIDKPDFQAGQTYSIEYRYGVRA